jgi:hypothetical protein
MIEGAVIVFPTEAERQARERAEIDHRAERLRIQDRQRTAAWNQTTDALRHQARENWDEAKQSLSAALSLLAAADKDDRQHSG